MRIGIVTFHNAINYGAVLQAYAMREFLRRRGHDVFFLNETETKSAGWIHSIFGKNVKSTVAKWKKQIRKPGFRQFHRDKLEIKEENEKRSTCPSCFDALVVGSDQIWNPAYLNTQQKEDHYFLVNAPDSCLKIAYAASLGTTALTDHWRDRFESHLKRFNAISVREDSAVRTLQPLTDKTVTWVPDPVLLLTSYDYEREFSFQSTQEPCVFSYFLRTARTQLINDLQTEILNFYGDTSIYESLPYSLPSFLLRPPPSPGQWLRNIAASRFVTTNSFHAVAFSILFKKPFVVLPASGHQRGMNTRFESFLNRLGLADRILYEPTTHNINNLLKTNINWHSVFNELDQYRQEGIAFLTQHLHDCLATPEDML